MAQLPYSRSAQVTPGDPNPGFPLYLSDEPRDLQMLQIGGFVQTIGFPLFTPEELGDVLELCDDRWAAARIEEGAAPYTPIWTIGQLRDLLDVWFSE